MKTMKIMQIILHIIIHILSTSINQIQLWNKRQLDSTVRQRHTSISDIGLSSSPRAAKLKTVDLTLNYADFVQVKDVQEGIHAASEGIDHL